MTIMATVQPESGRTGYAGSDFPYPFQLRFSKEGIDLIVENRPGSDLVAWSGFGQTRLIWKQAGV